MIKPANHKMLSNRVCATRTCTTRIKANVAIRKAKSDKPIYCFPCYVAREYAKGHVMQASNLKQAGIRHKFEKRPQ